MKKLIVIFLLMAMGSLSALAQNSAEPTRSARSHTREGNKAYKKGHYDDAEAQYHLALKGDSSYYKAQYNLGNSLYRQERYDDAARHYGIALQSPALKGKQRANAFHNLGNSHLRAGLQQRGAAAASGAQQGNDGGMQHFQQAVDNYKEALKLSPRNKDTKYNLSYAQKMLAQAQQNQQGGGQGQQGQDQQQKQQGGGQGQKGQEQQQGQQQNQQGQGQQPPSNRQGQQGQEQRRQRQSADQQRKEQRKRDAEQLLGAVKNNEKNTMKEQQRAKEAMVDSKIEKDW